MPIALSFMAEYPEVTLNLIASDQRTHMVDEHIDVAIRLGHLADSALYAVKTGDFRLITCASPDYLERHGTPTDPRELSAHDGILFGTRQMFWTYRIDGEEMICAPRTRIAVNSAAGNLAAALGGVGIWYWAHTSGIESALARFEAEAKSRQMVQAQVVVAVPP